MSGKKKKNPRVPQPLVRLSQCMIVKNEEKNIEKALGWAKRFAFEQIVVDTGSTDRTVEIAEKLGAKIYHFEWIDDFSAAKNYAIEQASGNWIAFLDADEYFSEEDAKKMMAVLKRIQTDPELKKDHVAVRCPWVQLNDLGHPFSVFEQIRVFRNRPDMRYVGRIHEYIKVEGKAVFVEEINIMHTGYTKEAYSDTQKAERNIRLLRKELESQPDNPGFMVYLADSLLIEPTTQERRDEGMALYKKALKNRHELLNQLLITTYTKVIRQLLKEESTYDEALYYARMAYNDLPGNMDFSFFYGVALSRKKESALAYRILRECEEQLINTKTMPISAVVLPNPGALFYEIALAAQALRDTENVIKYLTLSLKENKYPADVLLKYVNILTENGIDGDSIFGLLSKMYDLNSVKDRLFVTRCAKKTENISLFNKLYEMLSDEDREQIESRDDKKSDNGNN